MYTMKKITLQRAIPRRLALRISKIELLASVKRKKIGFILSSLFLLFISRSSFFLRSPRLVLCANRPVASIKARAMPKNSSAKGSGFAYAYKREKKILPFYFSSRGILRRCASRTARVCGEESKSQKTSLASFYGRVIFFERANFICAGAPRTFYQVRRAVREGLIGLIFNSKALMETFCENIQRLDFRKGF